MNIRKDDHGRGHHRGDDKGPPSSPGRKVLRVLPEKNKIVVEG